MFQVKEQTTRALIEVIRREFQTQLEKVDDRAESGEGTRAGAVKPRKFDLITSWAVFRRQFQTAAKYNC